MSIITRLSRLQREKSACQWKKYNDASSHVQKANPFFSDKALKDDRFSDFLWMFEIFGQGQKSHKAFNIYIKHTNTLMGEIISDKHSMNIAYRTQRIYQITHVFQIFQTQWVAFAKLSAFWYLEFEMWPFLLWHKIHQWGSLQIFHIRQIVSGVRQF